jgi:hypothetical protein
MWCARWQRKIAGYSSRFMKTLQWSYYDSSATFTGQSTTQRTQTSLSVPAVQTRKEKSFYRNDSLQSTLPVVHTKSNYCPSHFVQHWVRNWRPTPKSSKICVIRRAAQIPGTWSLRVLQFAQWCLIFSAQVLQFFQSHTKLCTSSHAPSRKRHTTFMCTRHSRTARPKYRTPSHPFSAYNLRVSYKNWLSQERFILTFCCKPLWLNSYIFRPPYPRTWLF